MSRILSGYLALTFLLIAGGNMQALGNTQHDIPKPHIRLMIFEPQTCPECQALNEQLETLQTRAGNRGFTISRYVLGDPKAKEAFTQHQVTTLPEYILIRADDQVLLDMKGTIQPDLLVWSIKDALGQSETLEIPQAYRNMLPDAAESEAPMVLLFWSWDDPAGQALAQQMMNRGTGILATAPQVFSFDAGDSAVQTWMNQMGLDPGGPAYVLVTPQKTIFRKSMPKARPWQLVQDLQAYADRFNSTVQTILVRLESPVPDDGVILPATMPPKAPPASHGQSPL